MMGERRPTVLIIDDDPVARLLAREALNSPVGQSRKLRADDLDSSYLSNGTRISCFSTS